jgi:hypothetical protein
MTDTPPVNLPATLSNDEAYCLMPGTPAEAQIPLPGELVQLIRGHVEADVAAMRQLIEQRGGVHAPADVYGILRYLSATDELLAEYARLIGVVRKETLKPLTEEVLADGVGADTDGKPVGSLTVPDAAGDIRITRKSRNVHTITPEAILPAFASMFADQHVDAVLNATDTTPGMTAEQHRAAVGVAIAEAIVDALNNVGELGKFEPQVSKVRAYADALARAGHDNASSVVSMAIRTTREYDGISTERKH